MSVSNLPPLPRLRLALAQELEQRRKSVFDVPPSDWAAFQRALGEYSGVQSALLRVEALLQSDEGE